MCKYIVIVGLLYILPGCSLLKEGATDYAKFADANIAFSTTESVRMSVEANTVLEAAKIITDGFSSIVETKSAPLYQKTTTTTKAKALVSDGPYNSDDIVGTIDSDTSNSSDSLVPDDTVTVTETVYDNSAALIGLLASQQRSEAFKFLIPVIRDIFKQRQLNVKAPVTAGDVALAFVDQVPFMTTVAGMYGLGKEAARQAGDNISAVVSSGGFVSSNSASSNAYSIPTTTTTTTTTGAEPME